MPRVKHQHKYFIGVDPGQVHQGIALINEKDEVFYLADSAKWMPEELQGKDVPDLLKNNYQAEILRHVIERHTPEQIGMILTEGPNYSSSANVTQISIGSIHGVNWQTFFDAKVNFAVLTPKSIQYAIHGTAKDITKKMTMDEMKKRFPDWQGKNLTRRGNMNSNEGDALAMAYLAKKLYYLLYEEGTTLNAGEKEILISKKKYKGHPKGIVYNLNNKLFLFNDNGELVKSLAELKEDK